MSFLALYGFGWNDYETEAAPAYASLTSGHLWRFLTLAPGYGGSLELRAPFAFVPALWSGGQDAIYQAVSLPCLIAAAILGVWLVARMRPLAHSRLARATTLALCVVNPVTLYALQYGHAEELLGAVLCVAAVLSAQRGRAGWSGVLLGLAIVNKEWALLAVGPVLLASPRWRTIGIAATISACFYVPLLLPVLAGHASGAGASALAETSTGTIFQPWQLWWFFGSHGHVVRDAFGVVKLGYRTPPAWLGNIPHPLIIASSVPIALLAARRGRKDALLLLAFLLAIRFALDSWDTVYYPLPFIFALLAWEPLSRRRPPVLSLIASIVVWALFVLAPGHLSADAQSGVFLVVTVPALLALATALFAPHARLRFIGRAPHAVALPPRTPAVPS